MASLVRYPGGKRNKGNRNKEGPYYIRIWLTNLKKDKLIPTRTKNKREAERKLRLVQEKEWLVKARLEEDLLESINSGLGIFQKNLLSELVEKYLTSCRLRLAIATVKSYALALRDLKNAINDDINVKQINKSHFDVILAHLRSHYNEVTCNIRLRGLRAFLRWLVENDYIKTMPFKVRMVKEPERLPKFITPEELDKIYNTIKDPIMFSIFKTYEVTGMRLSELYQSSLEDEFLRVIGKNSKERIIPIPPEFIPHYYIAINAGYKTDRISKAFTAAIRGAKISGRKTLHALRHTYALRKYVELRDIYLVKQLLGHSSVTVTEIYTKFPLDYLKQVFNDIPITETQYKNIGIA